MRHTDKYDLDSRDWPNLFLVGVHRGGTSSLWAYLNQHPDIFMSPLKEPHYFSPRYKAGVASEVAISLTPPVVREEEYLRLFVGAQQPLRGEASVSYFGDPASPPAIWAVSPGAKILILLRDPVERAYSHYWNAVSYGAEQRPFSVAVEEEIAGKLPRGSQLYVGTGFYVEPFKRWRDAFPNNVHVLMFEEFVENTVTELQKIFRYLLVDEGAAERFHREERNGFALPKNRITAWLMSSQYARMLARSLVPPAMRPRLESALVQRGPKPPMSLETRALLEAVYQDEAEELQRLLSRPIPWQERQTTAVNA